MVYKVGGGVGRYLIMMEIDVFILLDNISIRFLVRWIFL